MKALAYDDYDRLSRGGGLVPVFREIPADLLTPVSAFLRLSARAERAFLLESVVGGERIARYSFLGRDPVATIEAHATRRARARGRRARAAWPAISWHACARRWAGPPPRCPGLPPLHGRRRRLSRLRRGAALRAPPRPPSAGRAAAGLVLVLPLAGRVRPRAPAAGAHRGRRARRRAPSSAARRCWTRWRRTCARSGAPHAPRGRRGRPAGDGRARRRRRPTRTRCGGPRSTSRPATSSRSCSRASARCRLRARPLHGLPRAAHGEPVALHVLPEGRRRPRSRAPRRRCWCASRAGAWRRVPSPARARAAPPRRRTTRWRRSCSRTRRSGPST